MTRHFIIIIAALAAISPARAQSSADALTRAQRALAEAKEQTAPDRRQTICDLKAYTDTEGVLVAAGVTSDIKARNAAITALTELGIDFVDSIRVLPADRWGLTRLTAASHRTAGRHSAEMATQSVMGTPLRILEEGSLKGKEWLRVQTPDGYIAYVPRSSVALKSNDEMITWRHARRFVVTTPWQLQAFRTSDTAASRDVVSDLVCGSIVTVPGGVPQIVNGRLHIELPDGRSAWAEAAALTPIEQWAAQDFDAGRILDTAYSLCGIPYLWGGTSTKALDCSGLSKVSYLSNGIILMRDASQQARTGSRIEASQWRTCRPGDLLFFGNKATGKVTHVAIYDHDGTFIHSSGRVRVNSLDPDSPDYDNGHNFLHAVRVAGSEETPGITRVRNHPWYF